MGNNVLAAGTLLTGQDMCPGAGRKAACNSSLFGLLSCAAGAEEGHSSCQDWAPHWGVWSWMARGAACSTDGASPITQKSVQELPYGSVPPLQGDGAMGSHAWHHPARLFSVAFLGGGSTDPALLQERPGAGSLGLQRESSPGQGPVVQRAGLGQAEAKIRAHSSPVSTCLARDCGSEGLGLLLPPHTDSGVTGGWFGLAQWPTMQQTGHQAGSAEACRAAELVWEGLPLCWRQWKPPKRLAQFLCGSAVLRQRKCEGG